MTDYWVVLEGLVEMDCYFELFAVENCYLVGTEYLAVFSMEYSKDYCYFVSLLFFAEWNWFALV